MLKYNYYMPVQYNTGGLGIVKIYYRTNSRWRTAANLDILMSKI